LILVVLGTHELPFTRLLLEVERLKKNGIIEDDVIVQQGHTKFESEYLTLQPFFSFEKMNLLYQQAQYIISHAGTGSVINALKKGKKVIVAPRLKKYGEHNDDHQLELVQVFTEKGHILCWNDGDKLEDVIQQIDTFTPVPYQSGNGRIVRIIEEFISEI
jgi:UDP-N-acetylglucosamine transferase subunit ALG13